jgi:hypothetical protein
MALTKPNHSPNQVTYDDLVAAAEERVKFLATRVNGWHGRHNLEVAKVNLALMKKFQKDPQVNLFDEFQKMKR